MKLTEQEVYAYSKRMQVLDFKRKEVAEMLQIDEATMSRIFSRKQDISSKLKEALRSILSVDIDDDLSTIDFIEQQVNDIQLIINELKAEIKKVKEQIKNKNRG